MDRTALVVIYIYIFLFVIVPFKKKTKKRKDVTIYCCMFSSKNTLFDSWVCNRTIRDYCIACTLCLYARNAEICTQNSHEIVIKRNLKNISHHISLLKEASFPRSKLDWTLLRAFLFNKIKTSSHAITLNACKSDAIFLLFFVEACVAEWLTPRTLDLEVRGSSLACRVVSLDKEVYSTLSLFTQVLKWVPATYCWG